MKIGCCGSNAYSKPGNIFDAGGVMNIFTLYKSEPNGWLTRELSSTNQFVLIKQPNLTPLQWAMRQVQEIHLGPDDIARTATVPRVREAHFLNYQYYQLKPSLCFIKIFRFKCL